MHIVSKEEKSNGGKMNYKKFKKVYDNAKTWSESLNYLKSLKKEDLAIIISILEDTNKLTGLNMRQEFYLSQAQSVLNAYF